MFRFGSSSASESADSTYRAAATTASAAPNRWARLIARMYHTLPLVCPGTARSLVAVRPRASWPGPASHPPHRLPLPLHDTPLQAHSLPRGSLKLLSLTIENWRDRRN